MIRFALALPVIALCTWGSLQWETHYYGTETDFYINMLTHFLGGAFTATGVLLIRELVNTAVRGVGPLLRWLYIPIITVGALIFIVLVVGLVWEVWEVIFKESTFMSIDTGKDVIMDMCGAYTIARLLGKNQHD
jgi:hypothetical protein